MKGIHHLLTKDKIAKEFKEIVYISTRSYPTENIQVIITEFLNLTQFPQYTKSLFHTELSPTIRKAPERRTHSADQWFKECLHCLIFPCSYFQPLWFTFGVFTKIFTTFTKKGTHVTITLSILELTSFCLISIICWLIFYIY